MYNFLLRAFSKEEGTCVSLTQLGQHGSDQNEGDGDGVTAELKP